MIVYVMPKDDSWVVLREHETEPVSVHDSRSAAIETAKEVVIGIDEAEMVILRSDGSIDNLGAYAVDPFPSEDNAPDFNTNDEEEEDEGV